MSRHLVFSDLHGQYKLWEKIKSFIEPDDVVYCLGDCADRGPDGWKIIKEVLDTPNITYIRGNHEQFLIDNDYRLWKLNGGDSTIEAMQREDDTERRRIRVALINTPLYESYINKDGTEIYLCHAGFDPEIIRYWSDEELLWNRYHISRAWPQEYKDDTMKIIHGHTPRQVMDQFIGRKDRRPKGDTGAYWYCDGHKCCIDQGSVVSNAALLLDLDTFEEYIFVTGSEDKDEHFIYNGGYTR